MCYIKTQQINHNNMDKKKTEHLTNEPCVSEINLGGFFFIYITFYYNKYLKTKYKFEQKKNGGNLFV